MKKKNLILLLVSIFLLLSAGVLVWYIKGSTPKNDEKVSGQQKEIELPGDELEDDNEDGDDKKTTTDSDSSTSGEQNTETPKEDDSSDEEESSNSRDPIVLPAISLD